MLTSMYGQDELTLPQQSKHLFSNLTTQVVASVFSLHTTAAQHVFYIYLQHNSVLCVFTRSATYLNNIIVSIQYVRNLCCVCCAMLAQFYSTAIFCFYTSLYSYDIIGILHRVMHACSVIKIMRPLQSPATRMRCYLMFVTKDLELFSCI